MCDHAIYEATGLSSNLPVSFFLFVTLEEVIILTAVLYCKYLIYDLPKGYAGYVLLPVDMNEM